MQLSTLSLKTAKVEFAINFLVLIDKYEINTLRLDFCPPRVVLRMEKSS